MIPEPDIGSYTSLAFNAPPADVGVPLRRSS